MLRKKWLTNIGWVFIFFLVHFNGVVVVRFRYTTEATVGYRGCFFGSRIGRLQSWFSAVVCSKKNTYRSNKSNSSKWVNLSRLVQECNLNKLSWSVLFFFFIIFDHRIHFEVDQLFYFIIRIRIQENKRKNVSLNTNLDGFILGFSIFLHYIFCLIWI